ncbi:MAG: hypothetical protein M5U07_22535 [Xanthobacteraceae bacterium]|nr:hypothetical protein [Xanthobacteraceae bacterium]
MRPKRAQGREIAVRRLSSLLFEWQELFDSWIAVDRKERLKSK